LGSLLLKIKTKNKKASVLFLLAFDVYVHNVLQLSNFFLKDLEKLREFTEKIKTKQINCKEAYT